MPDAPVVVSPDNFARAESDLYFGNIVKDDGFGKFFILRELTPIDHQLVIRANRDTLYSAAVFDLDAGPVTVTLPDAGDRFMSMQVIDEDHYTHAVIYDEGEHTITRDRSAPATSPSPCASSSTPATRTMSRLCTDFRTASSSTRTSPAASTSQLGSGEPEDCSRRTGDAGDHAARHQAHLRHQGGHRPGAAPGRVGQRVGRQPGERCALPHRRPRKTMARRCTRSTIGDVPVDGFWSVTVYNKDGYFAPNPQNAYSFNNVTAEKGKDGNTTSNSAAATAATARCPTACRSRPGGTTPSGCTGHSSDPRRLVDLPEATPA